MSKLRMASVAKTVAESLEASSWMTGSSEVVGLYRVRSMVWRGREVLVLIRS